MQIDTNPAKKEAVPTLKIDLQDEEVKQSEKKEQPAD